MTDAITSGTNKYNIYDEYNNVCAFFDEKGNLFLKNDFNDNMGLFILFSTGGPDWYVKNTNLVTMAYIELHDNDPEMEIGDMMLWGPVHQGTTPIRNLGRDLHVIRAYANGPPVAIFRADGSLDMKGFVFENAL